MTRKLWVRLAFAALAACALNVAHSANIGTNQADIGMKYDLPNMNVVITPNGAQGGCPAGTNWDVGVGGCTPAHSLNTVSVSQACGCACPDQGTCTAQQAGSYSILGWRVPPSGGEVIAGNSETTWGACTQTSNACYASPPPPPPAPAPPAEPTTPAQPEPGAAPVILTFEEHFKENKRSTPTQFWMDEFDGNPFDIAGPNGFGNEFTWSATGADRYELYDPSGTLWWSGKATTFITNDKAYMKSLTLADQRRLTESVGAYVMKKGFFYWKLKAYNGSQITEMTTPVKVYRNSCVACGS